MKMKGVAQVAVSLMALGLSNGASALPVVTNGLQQAYEFSGNLNDSAGSNNAVAVGSPGYTADRNGHVNSALDLNGNGQWAQFATPAVGSVATLSFWIDPKSTSDSGDYRLFDNRDGILNGTFALRFQNGGNLELWSSSWQQITSGAIGTNAWTNVTITLNGSLASAYVNGVLSGSSNDAAGYNIMTLGAGATFNWGGEYGRSFYGAMDDIYLYNRVLSATEIASLYSGVSASDGAAPEPSSLLLGALGLVAAFVARRRCV